MTISTPMGAQQVVARVTPAGSDVDKKPSPPLEEGELPAKVINGHGRYHPDPTSAPTLARGAPAWGRTVAIIHSRARTTLPQLVVRPRRDQAGVLWAALILSLAGGVGFFRSQWIDARDDAAAIASAWKAERENRTGIYVHLDEGVECKSPAFSQLWVDVVKDTCRALGSSYRELVLKRRGKR